KIADVLTECESTIDVDAGLDLVAIELVYDARGTLFKLLAVVLCPPRKQISFAVELAAGIVESVGDLMADHTADSAVIDRIVGRRVKERRLQDAGRERDVVVRAVVACVDSWRRKAP